MTWVSLFFGHRWSLANELGLVVVALYQRSLQLHYVEALVDSIKRVRHHSLHRISTPAITFLEIDFLESREACHAQICVIGNISSGSVIRHYRLLLLEKTDVERSYRPSGVIALDYDKYSTACNLFV